MYDYGFIFSGTLEKMLKINKKQIKKIMKKFRAQDYYLHFITNKQHLYKFIDKEDVKLAITTLKILI